MSAAGRLTRDLDLEHDGPTQGANVFVQEAVEFWLRHLRNFPFDRCLLDIRFREARGYLREFAEERIQGEVLEVGPIREGDLSDVPVLAEGPLIE